MRPWITFFSQTGTEIYNLCRGLGVYPDAIITNRHTMEGINKELVCLTTFREYKLNRTIWYMLPNKPTLESYNNVLSQYENPIITLHGYLRILPKEICEKYEIYNLHPGLIDKYPELKGVNPQDRAFKEGHKIAGCVIHKVVPEVDAGEIIISQGTSIENKNLNEVYEILHDTAFDLWKSFFTAYNILNR